MVVVFYLRKRRLPGMSEAIPVQASMSLCSYLLPLRRSHFNGEEAQAWASYFAKLSETGCEVLVVDGSPEEVFREHERVFGQACRHVGVNRRFGYLNDKVNGIHTGFELSTSEKIIVADDDIRYSRESLKQVCTLLDEYEVVRPQNFLRPMPWWALLEASRMLINRALLPAADYPGTCAFRRETFLKAGHYDGDVLFDNEEMLRHFALAGATVAYMQDLFVEKRAPTLRKWLEQRPRQAYEDFPLRAKTAFFFGLGPFLLLAGLFAGATAFAGAVTLTALGAILVALRGRARGEAAKFFPLKCCLFAPLWVAERTLSTYWAAWWRVTRGGYPFGGHLLSRGVGRAWQRGGRIATAHLRETS